MLLSHHKNIRRHNPEDRDSWSLNSDHPNNVPWRVQIMKFRLNHFSLASCYTLCHKVNVKFSMRFPLTENHTMKVYWGVEV
jgi:hypothetical protein